MLVTVSPGYALRLPGEDIESGEQATAAAELVELAQRHPLRERLWALRAHAGPLRCGYQAASHRGHGG